MGIVKEKPGKIKKKASDVFQDKPAAYLSTGKKKDSILKLYFSHKGHGLVSKKSKLTDKLLLTKLRSVAVALFIRGYSVIGRLAWAVSAHVLFFHSIKSEFKANLWLRDESQHEKLVRLLGDTVHKPRRCLFTSITFATCFSPTPAMRHTAEKGQLTLESIAIQLLAEACLIRWPS